MKTVKWMILASSLALLITTGCAMNRANVKALSQEQQVYYKKLRSMLNANSSKLELALSEQLKADRVRELNLLSWERDLQKAEVLLRVDANVTKNQKLLSMKLAEINLEEVSNLSGNQIDQSRKEAILKLYNKLSEAVESLEKNNDIIIKYLGSGDKKFTLRSLDVEGIVRTLSAIRSVEEELRQIEKRSKEEQKKESQQIQKSIERARDLLIKVFE